jgi:Reverse transcriptase (RNA-dependent DNA polymerase)
MFPLYVLAARCRRNDTAPDQAWGNLPLARSGHRFGREPGGREAGRVMNLPASYVDVRLEAERLGIQVRLAAQSDSPRQLIRAQDRFLNSPACKFLAAHRVRYDRARKSRYGTPSKESQAAKAAEVAGAINVHLPCDERVYIEAVRKGGEEYRLTCAFGELAQARQQLVVDLLRYREGLPHEQTMMNGGITAAIKRAQTNFAAGFQYSAELDIRRCFQSFRTENLSRLLRLPESVVEHVIRITNLVPVPSRTCRDDILHYLPTDPETPEDLFQARFGSEWEQARLGLPEGSRLSPLLAELLLAPVVRALTARRKGRVLTYADNFLLSATNEARLQRLVEDLQEELSWHPAGPVTVRDQLQSRGPRDSFEFLGYLLRPDGNRLSATWAPEHERRARDMRRQAYRKLQSTMPQMQKLEVLSRIEREHTAFTRSFTAWPDREQFNEQKLAGMRRALFPNGGPEEAKRPTRRRPHCDMANAHLTVIRRPK